MFLNLREMGEPKTLNIKITKIKNLQVNSLQASFYFRNSSLEYFQNHSLVPLIERERPPLLQYFFKYSVF